MRVLSATREEIFFPLRSKKRKKRRKREEENVFTWSRCLSGLLSFLRVRDARDRSVVGQITGYTVSDEHPTVLWRLSARYRPPVDTFARR